MQLHQPTYYYALEVYRNGTWVRIRDGLSATLVAFGAALATLEAPAETWRAVRSDGEVFRC